jgi:RNase H-fold protein (predicted Holliday junction resolvase)
MTSPPNNSPPNDQSVGDASSLGNRNQETLLAFDPGRDKCGIAVAVPPEAWPHQVVPADRAIAELRQLQQLHQADRLIIGNQTTAKLWRDRLDADWPDHPTITFVDERNSTLEARDRYWQLFPPQGLMRLVPPGLRQPPRPIDDIVALILIERYWQGKSSLPSP